jgi:hypothetical protein
MCPAASAGNLSDLRQLYAEDAWALRESEQPKPEIQESAESRLDRYL